MKEFNEWMMAKEYTIVSSVTSKEWCCLDRRGHAVSPVFNRKYSLQLYLMGMKERELETDLGHKL